MASADPQRKGLRDQLCTKDKCLEGVRHQHFLTGRELQDEVNQKSLFPFASLCLKLTSEIAPRHGSIEHENPGSRASSKEKDFGGRPIRQLLRVLDRTYPHKHTRTHKTQPQAHPRLSSQNELPPPPPRTPLSLFTSNLLFPGMGGKTGVPLLAAAGDGPKRPRPPGPGVGNERHVAGPGQGEHNQPPAAHAADPVAGYQP